MLHFDCLSYRPKSLMVIQIDLPFGTRLPRGLYDSKSFGSVMSSPYDLCGKGSKSRLQHSLGWSAYRCRTISCTPHRTILILPSYKDHSASNVTLFLASLVCPYSSSPYHPLLYRLLLEILFLRSFLVSEHSIWFQNGCVLEKHHWASDVCHGWGLGEDEERREK